MPMSVTYSSTRGEQSGLDFRSVVLQGLARDRGLFVPETLPTVTMADLKEWRSLSYPALAVQVIRKFVQDDQVPYDKLNDIVHRSCAAFRVDTVTPVVEVGGHAVLELFHGPTFAFKDVALQMLGNFFEYFLETGSNDGQLSVLGATSGDTGSAAIAGLRGKKGIHCIILFPKDRVSAIQERQMTTVPDENIHCVAIVDGTFDDCQDLVKASFNTPEFRDKVHLGAVNSINWCRVLAQTTYYFWSYLRMTDKYPDIQEVHCSVPTGNFGDILAGYYAKHMGLPLGKLVVATNENDILYRFFTAGEYHRQSINPTISPSMDICVSSNFERYLFHLAGNNAKTLAGWMQDFERTSKLTLSGSLLRRAQEDFDAARVDTAETLRIIQVYNDQFQYVLCPHSAVGVAAVHQLRLVGNNTICLATAHAAKFPDAVGRAVQPLPEPPIQLAQLASLPTRRTELRNDLAMVQQFVEECVTGKKKRTLLSVLSSSSGMLTVAAAAVAIAAGAWRITSRRR